MSAPERLRVGEAKDIRQGLAGRLQAMRQGAACLVICHHQDPKQGAIVGRQYPGQSVIVHSAQLRQHAQQPLLPCNPIHSLNWLDLSRSLPMGQAMLKLHTSDIHHGMCMSEPATCQQSSDPCRCLLLFRCRSWPAVDMANHSKSNTWKDQPSAAQLVTLGNSSASRSSSDAVKSSMVQEDEQIFYAAACA